MKSEGCFCYSVSYPPSSKISTTYIRRMCHVNLDKLCIILNRECKQHNTISNFFSILPFHPKEWAESILWNMLHYYR